MGLRDITEDYLRTSPHWKENPDSLGAYDQWKDLRAMGTERKDLSTDIAAFREILYEGLGPAPAPPKPKPKPVSAEQRQQWIEENVKATLDAEESATRARARGQEVDWSWEDIPRPPSIQPGLKPFASNEMESFELAEDWDSNPPPEPFTLSPEEIDSVGTEGGIGIHITSPWAMPEWVAARERRNRENDWADDGSGQLPDLRIYGVIAVLGVIAGIVLARSPRRN